MFMYVWNDFCLCYNRISHLLTISDFFTNINYHVLQKYQKYMNKCHLSVTTWKVYDCMSISSVSSPVMFYARAGKALVSTSQKRIFNWIWTKYIQRYMNVFPIYIKSSTCQKMWNKICFKQKYDFIGRIKRFYQCDVIRSDMVISRYRRL